MIVFCKIGEKNNKGQAYGIGVFYEQNGLIMFIFLRNGV